MEPWKRRRPRCASGTTNRLQWGHGDGAVEEVDIDDIARQRRPLQWGHGDGAVEEDRQRRLGDGDDDASMGPRRWSRGRVPYLRRRFHQDPVASMGPRRWSRGRGQRDVVEVELTAA